MSGFSLFMFWISIGIITYTYVLFPLLLVLRALLFNRTVNTQAYKPKVSIIIVAHNEADIILRKLENVFQSDYPREKLEVILASDGSDDGMNELVTQYTCDPVIFLSLPRRGKNQAVNTAVSIATGDVLIFTDADTILEKDALSYLVAPFADPTVGGVGGDYHYVKSGERNAGERTYWRFDRVLKYLQSRAGCMTSASGQIYALRRELFKPVPRGVTDDFYISTQAPAAHRRLVFEPRAVGRGPIAASCQAEFVRKVRVITRGLWSVWQMRKLLVPSDYGFYAIQMLSHKILRRLMFAPLLILMITAPQLWFLGWLYQMVTVGLGLILFLGAFGLLFRANARISKWKLISLPTYFLVVNAATAIAVANLIFGRRYDTWGPERAAMRLSPKK